MRVWTILGPLLCFGGPSAVAGTTDAAVALQAALGAVRVKSQADVARLLDLELRGHPLPERLTGTVEIAVLVERVQGRLLVVSHPEHGRIAVFVSMTADVTGLLEPGVRVRIAGQVIEDFVRTADTEVMAYEVTTIEGRHADRVAGL